MKRTLVVLFNVAILSLVAAVPAQAQAAGALVTVASPTGLHPRNAQNEPALAVDPTRTTVLAAGGNDLVDMQPCSQAASTTRGACSFPLGTFTRGVGLTGIYFSFDSGNSWTQPTYTGLTAADCSPTIEPCAPHVGPIHTIPNFYENGLRSRSDPGVAFGPAPDASGTFSWENGSRLYAATLATNLTDTRIERGGINSNFAITVSHIDNITPARVADQSNWSRPYFVPAHISSSAGLDKEQIWADNAASSAFFGRVYTCYSDFHSFSQGNNFSLFPNVAVSADGGVSWTKHTVAAPTTAFPRGFHQGCTVRTDSHGVAYAFFTHFSETSNDGFHTMVKSFDGGRTWTRPQDVVAMNDACLRVDPISGRCVADGIAGARIDLAAMPSVDIANGAPSGADATNEIIDAWSDGRLGLNNEKSMLSYSTDGGATWSSPAVASLPGDRSVYSAPSIAPNGSRAYVVYMAFAQPFQSTTANPRPEHGVFRSAPIASNGAPGTWTTEYIGPSGDARGSSQGRILYNEFLGDYVYAIATRTYGAGVWTDVRRTADCPAMDAWRQESVDAGQLVFPAPWPLGDCPTNFGNTDIFSATTG
ncbi:MAG: exo-alpha-sialidase [Chloroflexi bacterium]|nr:MAG: exo-alpha-sialidase [Chloroflexota bacterium]